MTPPSGQDGRAVVEEWKREYGAESMWPQTLAGKDYAAAALMNRIDAAIEEAYWRGWADALEVTK